MVCPPRLCVISGLKSLLVVRAFSKPPCKVPLFTWESQWMRASASMNAVSWLVSLLGMQGGTAPLLDLGVFKFFCPQNVLSARRHSVISQNDCLNLTWKAVCRRNNHQIRPKAMKSGHLPCLFRSFFVFACPRFCCVAGQIARNWGSTEACAGNRPDENRAFGALLSGQVRQAVGAP